MKQIRTTHEYSFRFGEWADLLGEFMYPIKERQANGPCYFVRFPDGVIDWWLISDKTYGYEFREGKIQIE